MDELIIKTIISVASPVGVAVGIFFWLLYKRTIIWRAELDKAEAREGLNRGQCDRELLGLKEARDQELASLQAAHGQARQDFIDRILELESTEKDYREFCMEMTRQTVKALDIAKAVVDG